MIRRLCIYIGALSLVTCLGCSPSGKDAATAVEGSTAAGGSAEDPTMTEVAMDPTPSCETLEPVTGAIQSGNCAHLIEHPTGIIDLLPHCEGSAAAPPSQLHLGFATADASSTVTMNWMTAASQRLTEVKIGLAPDALNALHRGHSFRFARLDDRLIHEVHICQLTPSTTYYYQVGGGDAWSETYSFVTAPPMGSTEEFVFAAGGDSRSADYALFADALQAMLDAGAEFVIFGGDAVELGPIQSGWDGFFGVAQEAWASLPFLPANGNHDLLAVNYLGQFALPGDEENFHVRYGNALFVVINDFVPTFNELKAYLDTTLTDHADATWKILVNHRAFYSASNHGSIQILIDELAPVIDTHGVDLVINGHDHNYERSKPIRGGEVVPVGEGTVYLVTAGLGAPLYGSGSDWWTELSEETSNWVLGTVSGDRLEIQAFRDDGAELDRFSLTK